VNERLKQLAVENSDLDELEEAVEALTELEQRFRRSGKGLAEMRELLATLSRIRNRIN
jgi:hypothetical protein